MPLSDKTRREVLRYSLMTGSVTAGLALAGCTGDDGGDGSGDGGAGNGDGTSGSGASQSKVEEWKEKAKNEENGQLKFMHAMSGDSAPSFIKAVEEKFPWMNINGVKGSENIATIFAADYRSGNPTIDAVWYEAVFTLRELDMLFDLTQLPNYAELPEKAKGGKYWAPFKFLTHIPLYNTELMNESEAPTDWGELTDPKYKGRMVMTQSPKWPVLAWIKKEFNENWIQEMGEQDIRIATGFGVSVKALAAGQRALMPGAFMKYLYIADRAAGTPVTEAPFKNLLYLPTPLGISNEAPHPNTTKFFHNWFFSEDGAKTLAKSLKQSCMGTVTNPICNPQDFQERARQYNPILIEQLRPDKREKIAQEWKQAMGL